jgi:hypothetical protein
VSRTGTSGRGHRTDTSGRGDVVAHLLVSTRQQLGLLRMGQAVVAGEEGRGGLVCDVGLGVGVGG